MKVKFNTSVACSVLDKVFNIGDIVEIDDARAKDFIKSKIVTEIKEKKTKKKTQD